MSKRESKVAIQLNARFDEYAVLEEVDLQSSPGHIEYRHTTTDEGVLGPSIVGAVAAVARGLGILSPPPEDTDVLVRSPEAHEQPLKYHVTRREATRASHISYHDSDDKHRELIARIVSDAENFPNLTCSAD